MGGGGGNDGSKQIRRQEQERQQRIRESTERINNIFKQFEGYDRQLVNPTLDMSRQDYVSAVNNALAGNIDTSTRYQHAGRGNMYDQRGPGYTFSRSRSASDENFGDGTWYRVIKEQSLNNEAKNALRQLGLTDEQLAGGVGTDYFANLYDQAQNNPDSWQYVKSGDSLFDQYRQDYLGYQQPQLQNQYQDAQKSVQFDLARRGATESTAGQQRLADLLEEYNNQQTLLQNRATQAKNQYRSSVESQRQALISQAQAGMAPTDAANLASNAFNTLQSQTPEYDALGDVFGQFADIYGLNLRAQGAGLGSARQASGGAAGLPGQSGTSKIRT